MPDITNAFLDSYSVCVCVCVWVYVCAMVLHAIWYPLYSLYCIKRRSVSSIRVCVRFLWCDNYVQHMLAQWLKHQSRDRKVPGSSPRRDNFLC